MTPAGQTMTDLCYQRGHEVGPLMDTPVTDSQTPPEFCKEDVSLSRYLITPL